MNVVIVDLQISDASKQKLLTAGYACTDNFTEQDDSVLRRVLSPREYDELAAEISRLREIFRLQTLPPAR